MDATTSGAPASSDVVVVGARCAGASVALLLARAGLRVRVLERADRLGDVVSGHMVKSAGAARLARWGLLDDVLASGAPAMRVPAVWIGGERHDPPPPPPEVPPNVAPRRMVLDQILLDAARAAGARVDLGTSVTGVVRERGRVVGVHTPDGEVRARLIVGADGRTSRLARLFGAETYWQLPPATYAYYTYWAGTAIDGLHVHLAPGVFSGMFPTNDDRVLVFTQAPHAQFATARRDPIADYLGLLAWLPGTRDLLGDGHIVERLRGIGDMPTFFRESAGPGWVLAGDAGHHKDPLVARGIADAFRDADLIAAAVAGAWDADDETLDAALRAYQEQRDATARPLAEANDAVARLDGTLDDVVDRWLALLELEMKLDVAEAGEPAAVPPPPRQRAPMTGGAAGLSSLAAE
jgi:flavin-dependent dehydrogenase